MKYKFIDHTADVMFEAYGKTLNKVFENVQIYILLYTFMLNGIAY